MSIALPKVGYDCAINTLSETLDFLCIAGGSVFVRQPLWSSPFMLGTSVCMSQIMVLQTGWRVFDRLPFPKVSVDGMMSNSSVPGVDLVLKPAYLLLHIKKQDFPHRKIVTACVEPTKVTGTVSSASSILLNPYNNLQGRHLWPHFIDENEAWWYKVQGLGAVIVAEHRLISFSVLCFPSFFFFLA